LNHVPAVIQLPFPHDFSVELAESAGAERPVRIPIAPEEVESLLVRFTPAAAEPWLGAFARGFAADDLISGVFGWPDGKSVAVVAAGYGYVVNVADPKSWVRLQPMPITGVEILPEHKLIVFADFTHMFAYNAERNLWKTERLSWDGLSVTQLGTDHIFGTAWDAMQDKEVEFVVDVRTGEHTGGARPWAKR